jgi:8-oxo-dGTP pyrophosphatase MutT (NUDIX family)
MMAAGSLTTPRLPAEWLERLRGGLRSAPEHRPEYWQMGGGAVDLQPALRAHLPEQLRPASVLLPIIADQGKPRLLLTLRSAHLRQHAGQISFPGGSLESSDADPMATALREAYEEVGIEPAFIEPLGFLCDHVVMTGFRITPIVALLHPGYTLRINEAEVAEVFDLPLEALLDPLSYHKSIRHLRGTDVELIEIRHEGRIIWGATAGILQSVCEILRDPMP